MSDRPHLQPCSAQLDREWRYLRANRTAVLTARSWAARVDADLASSFRSLNDLGELIDATQRDAGARGERTLLALVELATTEQLAGRIIVQRLLPGLISASAPYRYHAGDPIQLAVGALWISICAYDRHRPRRHVAAALISDAVYKAFRQHSRRRSAGEEVCPPHRFDELVSAQPTDPLVELATTLAEASRFGVPKTDIDFLRSLVEDGSSRRLAEELDVTPRTVRNRRDRAVRHVRRAVCEEAEQAA